MAGCSGRRCYRDYEEPKTGPGGHAGATFPRVRIAQETKLAKNRLESLALQHELLAFSGFAGLRLFAAFVKLDQAYPPLKSRAPQAQNSLRTIGWSEVSSFKVMDTSSTFKHMRSRTRRSGWRPFTMWPSFPRPRVDTHPAVAEVRVSPHSPIFGASCLRQNVVWPVTNGGRRRGLYGKGRRTAVGAETHSPPHVQRAGLALA